MSSRYFWCRVCAAIGRQRIVDMPPVIVGQSVLLGKIHPFLGLRGFVRSVIETKTKTPVNHTGVVALGTIGSFHILIRPPKEFRIGAHARFIDPPVTGLVVKRLSELIDLRLFVK